MSIKRELSIKKEQKATPEEKQRNYQVLQRQEKIYTSMLL